MEEAFQGRNEVHPSGKIMVLRTMCPWHSHIFDVEKQAGCEGEVLYVLFQDVKGSWFVVAAHFPPLPVH